MEQKTSKYGIRQVLSNNLFLLKQIGRVSPWRIPAIMVDAMADWSKGLIFRVFVVGYVLNQIQSDTPLKGFFCCGTFVTSFLCMSSGEYFSEELFFPRSDLKIQSHFMKLAFGKAREADLECYENTEYYEKYIRALNALKSRPRMVLDSVEMLFGALFGFFALSGTALSMDGFMIFSSCSRLWPTLCLRGRKIVNAALMRWSWLRLTVRLTIYGGYIIFLNMQRS